MALKLIKISCLPLDFLNLPVGYFLESDLERGIIKISRLFLLELGKGFAFVERQQRIRFDDDDFYIDFVFYNFKLKRELEREQATITAQLAQR
ncbi:MAG: hypothetical protein CTY34_08230 [Methylobacter sp.]|nr:MAG: hypothetical protein CTY34_08230 [Methylobacter sp.]PPD17989.1 MAG: hypothetical protein CTY24_13820 [Methylobacter sp.]PPD33951.1 MAG: hypothetical protein CTY18_09025 [Methylomonas sp.]